MQSSSKSIFTGFLSDFETKTNETSSTIDSQKEFHRNPTIGTLGSTLPKNPESGKSSSADVIDLWTWGDQPGKDQLEHCLNLLCQVSPKENSKFSGKRVNLTGFFLFSGTFQEQQKLCNDAAGTTLYSYRFRQRSTVLKRYYIAQCRNGQKASAASDQVDSEDYSNLEKIKKKEAKVQGTQGLARY